MKKTAIIVLSVLLAANIIATVLLGVKISHLSNCADDDKKAQYVMYVGTNDKDTYEQIISTEDAKAIVDKICTGYLGGYTLQDAIGSWADEKGIPTHENTIVCYFDDADEATVYKIADEIIKALNQNTVLIEKDTIHIDFYGGSSN